MADLRELIDNLDEQIANDRDINTQLDEFMGEVVEVWRGYSPSDTGEYKDSVEVITPARAGTGRVGATAPYAHIIEYGSEDTPEFAPKAKVEAHFNRGT